MEKALAVICDVVRRDAPAIARAQGCTLLRAAALALDRAAAREMFEQCGYPSDQAAMLENLTAREG